MILLQAPSSSRVGVSTPAKETHVTIAEVRF